MRSLVTVVILAFSIALFEACVPGPSVQNTSVAAMQNDSVPKRNLHGKARHIAPYPILLQKFFTHTWGGFTTCNSDTAKAASVLTITSKDSADVYVAGLMHSKAKVTGAIRGYMVIIKPQRFRWAGKEYLVEGSFILSNNHNSLNGWYTNRIKGETDSCMAFYQAIK